MDVHIDKSSENKVKGQASIGFSSPKCQFNDSPEDQVPFGGSSGSGSTSSSSSTAKGSAAEVLELEEKKKAKMIFSFTLLSCHVVHRKQRKLYKCDVCQLLYRHVFSLKRHFLRNHVTIKYVSKSDMNNCKIKIKNKTDDTAFSDSDDKSSVSSSNSGANKKQFINEIVCAKDQNVAISGLYRCHLCKKLNFDTREEIRSHFKIHVGSTEGSFPCEKCNVIFPHKQALYRHLTSHSEANSFPCTTCSKVFDSRASYLKHVATHTDNRTCKYCKKVLSTKANKCRHERIHEGMKPYPCKHCNSQFSQSGDLKKHVKKQHAAFYIPCTLCTSLFSSKTALNKHTMDKHNVHHSQKLVVQPSSRASEKPESSVKQMAEVQCAQSSSEQQSVQPVSEEGKEVKAFHCPVCKKRYRSYLSMLQHRRHQHPFAVRARKVNRRTKYYTKAVQQKLYPKRNNSVVSEEVFYKNISNVIAKNLSNHVDGKLSQLNLKKNNFTDSSIRSFPNTSDVDQALHMEEHGIKTHISEPNSYIANGSASSVFDFHRTYDDMDNNNCFSDSDPDLSIYPGRTYVDYKNIDIEERKKLIGRTVKSVILCSVCKEVLPSYQAFKDHSSNNHPNVLCTYVEIEGEKDSLPVVPEDMLKQFLSPVGICCECNVPPPLSVINCTKCQVVFSNAAELHQHIISCCGSEEVTPMHVRRAITHRKIKRTMKKRINTSCIKPSGVNIVRKTVSPTVVEKTSESVEKNGELRKQNSSQLNIKPSVGRPRSNLCILCPHCKQSFRTKTLLNTHINRCYKRVVMKNKCLKMTLKKAEAFRLETPRKSQSSKVSSYVSPETNHLQQVEKPVSVETNQIPVPPQIESPVERLSPSLEIIVNSIKEKLTAEELSPLNPTFSWMEDGQFIAASHTSQLPLISEVPSDLQRGNLNSNPVPEMNNKPCCALNKVAKCEVSKNIDIPNVDTLPDTPPTDSVKKIGIVESYTKLNSVNPSNNIESDISANHILDVLENNESLVDSCSSTSAFKTKSRIQKSKAKSNPYVKRRKRKSKVGKTSISASGNCNEKTDSFQQLYHGVDSSSHVVPGNEEIVTKPVDKAEDALPFSMSPSIPESSVSSSKVQSILEVTETLQPMKRKYRSFSVTSANGVISGNCEIMQDACSEKKVQECSDKTKISKKGKQKCPYCMVDFTYLSTFHRHTSTCQEKQVKKERDETQQLNSPRMLPKRDEIEESMINLLRHQSRQSKMMKEVKTDDSNDVKNFQTYTCDSCHRIFLSLFKLLQHRVVHKLQNTDEQSAFSKDSATNHGNNAGHQSNPCTSSALSHLEISTSSSVSYTDHQGPSSAPSCLHSSQSSARLHFAPSRPLSVEIPSTSSMFVQSGPSSAPVRLINIKPSLLTSSSSPLLRSSSVGSQLEQLESQSSKVLKLEIPLKPPTESPTERLLTSELPNVLQKDSKESVIVPSELDSVPDKPSSSPDSIVIVSEQKCNRLESNTPLPKKEKKGKKLILRRDVKRNQKVHAKKRDKSSHLLKSSKLKNTDPEIIEISITDEKVATASEEISVLKVFPALKKRLMKSGKSTSNSAADKTCSLCGKTFYSLNFKKRHMLVKHSEQPTVIQSTKLSVNKVKKIVESKKLHKNNFKRSVLKRECKKQVLSKKLGKKPLLPPARQKK